MSTLHPYTVPVIPSDLRRAEFVKQFADTVDYLDSVSQDMFNRIAIRLNVYRAQLNKFDERIQHANAHIDHIKGSKRAIQVHSSARYPVEQTRSTYKSIFECDMDKDENKPPVLHYNPFRLNEAVDKFIDRNDKESKSNDDTIIVLKQYENNFIQKTKKNTLNGLGKPPNNIRSVVSFLKYNTQENPYTQPTKIDPLSVTGRKRKQADEPTQSRIAETPAPGFYKQLIERPAIGDFGYSPTLGIVPQLSLPDNLPELGHYATFDDDTAIDWSGQQMTSIAPSLGMSGLPDLTDLSSLAKTSSTNQPPTTTVTVPPPPPVDIPAIIPLTSASNSAPPPAPPLPPPGPPPSLNASSALIPPPPPPPGDELQTTSNDATKDTDMPDDDDGGNPLLAQIRDFAKTNKLKSATRPNPVDESPLPSSHEQESIMESLKKRLTQRRAFINGENKSSSSATAEANAPPPPPAPSTGSAMTDLIAVKAKQIAEQQRRNNDSDNDDDDDDDEAWE